LALGNSYHYEFSTDLSFVKVSHSMHCSASAPRVTKTKFVTQLQKQLDGAHVARESARNFKVDLRATLVPVRDASTLVVVKVKLTF
jgi:hypothetical protein